MLRNLHKNRLYKKLKYVCILINGNMYTIGLLEFYGRVAKWLERLTAEQNIDGSSRTLGSKLGCSLTVYPAANGYLVATLGKLKAARKGTGHPTSLCRRLRISVPPAGSPQRTESRMGLIYTFLLEFYFIHFNCEMMACNVF